MFPRIRKSIFEPCIPTRGTTVPTGTEWIHEIKHDGCRLIVERDQARAAMDPQLPRLERSLPANHQGCLRNVIRPS
jgi:hypothetical protein